MTTRTPDSGRQDRRPSPGSLWTAHRRPLTVGLLLTITPVGVAMLGFLAAPRLVLCRPAGASA